ncbi:MAG TPA: hypothetical protein VN030_13310 [Cellvibrio sp.]|nr:hypothetical protein [Cellvibrio sp.]
MSENSLQLQVPIEHACFPHHFPGAPLVPGALLLQWIFASFARAQKIQVQHIQQVKFLAPVLPGDHLQIDFATSDDRQLRFDCYRDQTLIAKGKLLYRMDSDNEQ